MKVEVVGILRGTISGKLELSNGFALSAGGFRIVDLEFQNFRISEFQRFSVSAFQRFSFYFQMDRRAVPLYPAIAGPATAGSG